MSEFHIECRFEDFKDARMQGNIAEANTILLQLEEDLQKFDPDQKTVYWSRLYYEQGMMAIKANNLDQIRDLFEKSTQSALSAGSDIKYCNSEQARIAYLNLADMLSDQEAYNDCLKLYQRVVDIKDDISEVSLNEYSNITFNVSWRLVHLAYETRSADFLKWAGDFKNHYNLDQIQDDLRIWRGRGIQMLQTDARIYDMQGQYKYAAALTAFLLGITLPDDFTIPEDAQYLHQELSKHFADNPNAQNVGVARDHCALGFMLKRLNTDEGNTLAQQVWEDALKFNGKPYNQKYMRIIKHELANMSAIPA